MIITADSIEKDGALDMKIADLVTKSIYPTDILQAKSRDQLKNKEIYVQMRNPGYNSP